MPIALVTGAPDWASHVAIALKSEGFDVISAGEEVPPVPGSVDCAVVVLVVEESLRWPLGGSRPPSEIAARARPDVPRRAWRSYLDEAPEMGFADWRDEVLCLASDNG